MTTKQKQKRWTNRDRLIDLLQVEGHWMSLREISDRLGWRYDSTSSYVRRLVADGMVERRRIELNDVGAYRHEIRWLP